MHQPQERVAEEVERLFNERDTLRGEGGFCIVPDGRIVILIRFPFGIETNIVVVVVLIGIEPVTTIVVVLIRFVLDVGRLVETAERVNEGVASGAAGSLMSHAFR
jgi:hypothetical protein